MSLWVLFREIDFPYIRLTNSSLTPWKKIMCVAKIVWHIFATSILPQLCQAGEEGRKSLNKAKMICHGWQSLCHTMVQKTIPRGRRGWRFMSDGVVTTCINLSVILTESCYGLWLQRPCNKSFRVSNKLRPRKVLTKSVHKHLGYL